jgi:Na+/melibiose symporter-like transporter
MINPLLMIVCGMYILFHFQMNMRNTYLSVYLVDALHFSHSLISLFPAVSSAAALLLMVFVIPRFKENMGHRYMIVGFILSIVSYVMLILAPEKSMAIVILSTILYTVGVIVSMPYLEAALANSIEDDNRASVISILAVFMLLFISPSGIIGGWTYVIDPRIPFVLMTLAFMTSIGLMIAYMKKEKARVRGLASGRW